MKQLCFDLSVYSNKYFIDAELYPYKEDFVSFKNWSFEFKPFPIVVFSEINSNDPNKYKGHYIYIETPLLAITLFIFRAYEP